MTEPQTTERFRSMCADGELCRICGKPADAKIGEEIMPDDPNHNRHNLTAYLCFEHFDFVLSGLIPEKEWIARCALRYIELAHMDYDEAMDAAMATYGAAEDNGFENSPEEEADNDMECWND